MKLISFLLRYSKGILALAIVAGIVAGVSSMGLLAVISARLRGNPSGRNLLLAFLALCVLYPLMRAASEMLLALLAQTAVLDLRMRLSRQIMAAPLRHLEKIGAPRTTAALIEDVNSITNGVFVVPSICINAVTVLGCLVYLGWLSPLVLLMVLVLLVGGTLVYRVPMKFANKHLTVARQLADSLYGNFRALTQGTKELKIHAPRRADFFAREMQPTAVSLRSENLSAQRIFTVAGIWGQLIFYIAIGFLIFGVPAIQRVDIATLTSYALTILFMAGPLTSTITMMPVFNRAAVGLRKIEELGLSLASQSTEAGVTTAPAAPPAWQSLQMIEVTHVYHRERENSNFTLGPINLTFRPGELVFLIGGNGSGKTTFAKLLTGLYLPERGHLRLNGEPITQRNREEYRQLFSVVFTDFFLFQHILGLGDVDVDKQARQYIELLQLQHKVEVKDGQLSTLDLSQGQRKRLALLAAYLEDRPFYVFDEWAADQDPLFKEIFYLQLLPELKARGKTILAISHDDRYYHLGDRVIRLENGQLEYDRSAGETPHLHDNLRVASTDSVSA
jgi:putative pyoverdin transport system ATP-binding/permease protein